MIEKPSYVQAQGGGFAPVQNQHIPTTYTGFDATKTLDALSGFAQKIIKPMQDNAFLEGVTDDMAGAIEDRSWLTKEAYMQGVNYNKFSNTLSALSPKMTEQAKLSARDGDDVATFNKKIQPFLFEANAELDKLGLTGKARELAQRQLLEQPAAQLTAYQKEREEDTKYRMMKAMNENAANSFVSVAQTGNFGQLVRDIDAQNMFGGATAENYKAVSALFTDNGMTMLGSLNMSHEADRNAMNAFQNFLATGEARSRFTASDIEKLQSKLSPMYEKASNVLKADLGRDVEAFQMKVANGGFVSIDDFNNYDVKLQGLRANRVLSADDEAQLRGKVHSLLTDSVKAQADSYTIKNAMALDRVLNKIPDEKQTPETVRASVEKYGNTPAAMVDAVSQGIKLQNPHTVKTAAGVLWRDASLAFTLDPAKLADDSFDGTSQQAVQTMFNVIKNTRNVNPLYMQAISEAIPDADLREAVMIQASSGEQGNTIQQVQATMELKDKLKLARTTGDHSGLSKEETQFTPDNLKQGWFKGIFTTRDTQKSKYWYDMSETNRQIMAGELNAIYQNNIPALVKTNMPLVTTGQKAAAMLKANVIHPVQNGVVRTTPEFNRAVSYNMDGKKVLLSNEQFTDVLDSMGNDVSTLIAKGRGDRDDVRMAVDGNRLHVTQYDSSGMPIGAKTYTSYDLSKRAQELFDKKTIAAPPKTFMSVNSGNKTMYLDDRAATPFGSPVVAKAVLQHLTLVEGIVDGVRDTRPDKQKVGSQYKEVPSTGVGVSLIHHPEYEPKFKAAGTDPYKRGAVQSEFLNDYFTTKFNFMSSINAMGIPNPNSPDAVQYLPVYKAITSMAYYAPQAGQVLQKALVQARDGGTEGYTKAVAAVKALPQYKAEGGNLRRQNIDESLEFMARIGERRRYAQSLVNN